MSKQLETNALKNVHNHVSHYGPQIEFFCENNFLLNTARGSERFVFTTQDRIRFLLHIIAFGLHSESFR